MNPCPRQVMKIFSHVFFFKFIYLFFTVKSNIKSLQNMEGTLTPEFVFTVICIPSVHPSHH